MHVQENFVDTDGIVPAHLAGEGAVFVGRLSREKGVDVLIRAWQQLPGGAHLHIAGDGPDRAELEQLAESIAPGRVTFHGQLDTAKVHDLVRSSAVFVAPSVWHENQPLAVLDALACGRPVVATKLGGMPERITPGVDGDLVPAGDAGALAAAVGALVRNPERAADMGEAARAKAEQRFAPAAHAAAVERHYLSVMDGGRPRSAANAAPADLDDPPTWPTGSPASAR